MSFERIAESRIREAMERGEFDNLVGKGEPIDHTGYFAAPEHIRLGHSLLKSNGFVPLEVEVRHELDRLRTKLEATTDPAAQRELRREINDVQLKLDLLRDGLRRESGRRAR